jgi:hypothetical protein
VMRSCAAAGEAASKLDNAVAARSGRVIFMICQRRG